MAFVISVAKFLPQPAAVGGRAELSTFHDAEGTHAGNFFRDACSVYDVDNLVDVFVSVGLFFGEASPALGFGDDASRCQFAIDASPFGLFDGLSSAHQSARSVAGCAEGLLHASLLAGQHPARSAHVAGDKDRLTDLLVPFGDF